MKIEYNAPVTLTFIFLSLVALAADTLMDGALSLLLAAPHSFDPTSPGNWLGSVAHVLLHGGSAHWIGNMTFILILGAIVEEKYGSATFLIMIVVTAAATSTLNAVFFSTRIIGASGIVYLLIVLASITSRSSGKLPLTFLLVAPLYIGGELFAAVRSDNVSQFAHIAGGVLGGLFGLMLSGQRTRQGEASARA